MDMLVYGNCLPNFLGIFHNYMYWDRTSRLEAFCKKLAPRNFTKFTGKHLCQSLFFNKENFLIKILKKTLAQVFSCEFCETFKNTFLHGIPLVETSIGSYFHF